MQRFEKESPKGQRFWEVETSGASLYVRYGKVGAKGRTVVKECASDREAEGAARDKINEKLGDGYAEVPVPPSHSPLAPPPPSLEEQMSGKSVEELEKILEEERNKGALAPVVACTRALLEHDAEHFDAHYWCFRALDLLSLQGAVDGPEHREERNAQRDWVLAHTTGQERARNRYRARESEVHERLSETDHARVTEAFALIDEARQLQADEKETLDALTSSLFAQLALIDVLEGNHIAGFHTLYHLLCRDVTTATWRSALDNGVRDRHLGRVLDQLEQFEAWVLSHQEPPPLPETLAPFITTSQRPDDADALMLLVAGQKNYYSKSHLEDTWAPGRTARLAFLLHCGAKIDAVANYDKTAVLHHLAGVGDARAITFAIAHGAAVDPRDKNGDPIVLGGEWQADR